MSQNYGFVPREWQRQWVHSRGRAFLNINWRGSFGGVMPSKQVTFAFVFVYVFVFVSTSTPSPIPDSSKTAFLLPELEVSDFPVICLKS